MMLKQNALQLTAVQLSGAISLPILLAGYYVGANYSAEVGLPLIALGNAILLILALTYTQIGYYYQTITVELVEKFFGERGIVVCGISLLVLMTGWSIIQYHFIGLAMQSMLGIANLSGLIGIASYFVIRHGLNTFAYINKLLLPCLLVVLYLTLSQTEFNTSVQITNSKVPVALGLIMIMTTAAGMVFDCPTYYRHANSVRALRVSLILLFACIVPAMEIAGLYLAKNSALLLNTNSLSSFFRQFNLAGLIFFSLSSFLSNCLNVYSATLVTMHFTKTSYQKTLLFLCTIPALISLIDISDSLLTFLEVINSLAGIILLMIVTQRLFKGFNLDSIAEKERQHHEYLLYVTIIGALLLQFIPQLKPYGLFITTSLTAMLVMSIYCQTRKLTCNN